MKNSMGKPHGKLLRGFDQRLDWYTRKVWLSIIELYVQNGADPSAMCTIRHKIWERKYETGQLNTLEMIQRIFNSTDKAQDRDSAEVSRDAIFFLKLELTICFSSRKQ